ncbi:type II toxin-antitoxin system HicB family antitoxin [Halochromatium sp.]
MERLIKLHVEALDEGGYVATSDDVQGLVAQGRTVQETLQIAQDVARRLLEAQSERSQPLTLQPVESSFDYPLVISS